MEAPAGLIGFSRRADTTDITEPEPIHRILSHVGLDPAPPPIAPARDPPQGRLDFEQAPEDSDQSLEAPDDMS